MRELGAGVMKRGRCIRHAGAIVVAGVLAGLAWGCQNTRFAEAKHVRDERIRRLGRTYAAREAACDDNLRHLADICGESRAWHARCLRDTTTLVEVEVRRDVDNWREHRPVRRAYWHSVIEGSPEEIPDFVVKAIY